MSADLEQKLLKDRVVVVTGGTRGIGRAVALAAAEAGANLVVTYRDASKQNRARKTQAELETYGVDALLLQVDITAEIDRQALYEAIEAQFGRLDALILNAAGGLEADKGPEYARIINHDAQLALVEEALKAGLLVKDSWVIFMTSLWAHYWGKMESLPGYAPVARTKFEAEQDLHALEPQLAGQGAKLGVVVGHLITDTGAFALFKRKDKAQIEQLAQTIEGGQFPGPVDIAQATLEFLHQPDRPTGYTVFVGQPKE